MVIEREKDKESRIGKSCGTPTAKDKRCRRGCSRWWARKRGNASGLVCLDSRSESLAWPHRRYCSSPRRPAPADRQRMRGPRARTARDWPGPCGRLHPWPASLTLLMTTPAAAHDQLHLGQRTCRIATHERSLACSPYAIATTGCWIGVGQCCYRAGQSQCMDVHAVGDRFGIACRVKGRHSLHSRPSDRRAVSRSRAPFG